MNDSGTIHARVRSFIVKQFPAAHKASLQDTDSLVELGIIDSMGVLELVTFIESEFEIVLSDEDIVSDHFDSVTAIVHFIEEKLVIRTEG